MNWFKQSQAKPIHAILYYDGKVYADPIARMHADVVYNLDLDSALVLDGGFVINGKYKPMGSTGGWSAGSDRFQGILESLDVSSVDELPIIIRSNEKRSRKLAQTTTKLQFDTHNVNGKPIAYVTGNTFPIRDKLKNLGFTWYGPRKMWWMYRDKMPATAPAALSALGIDVSVTGAPISAQPAPTTEPVTEPVAETNLVKTDKTTGVERWGPNFPINPKIYETDIDVVHENIPLKIHVVWGREQDEKRHKTTPRYNIKMLWEGIVLRDRYGKPPEGGKWTSAGPTYNEDQLVSDFNKQIPGWAADPKSKLYHAIKFELEYRKHEPEYAILLDTAEKDYMGKEDFSAQFPPRQITLDETGYSGSFPVIVKPRVYRAYRDIKVGLYTGAQHRLAPRSEELAILTIPVTIHNVKDANAYVDQQITEHQNEIKEEYLKYLKSFAFTEQQQEQASAELKPIIDMISSGKVDMGKIKMELLKRQFIRTSRRQKQNAPGMAPMDSFNFIIDDKAIRNATFERGRYNSNSPEYFYTAIAYNLMRIKHNNIGFMPIFLDDAYRVVTNILHRHYDPSIQATQVAEYINNAARAVWQDLTGKKYHSWDEVYNDFYSGQWGSGTRGTQTGTRQTQDPVQTFAFFIESLNLGVSKEQVIQSPRSAYRQLALKLHPDSTQMEDKERASQLFSDLTSLYDRLPQNMKNAFSWHKYKKFSSC